MGYKGIAFDLDGVLVFTDKYHYQAWKEIADQEWIYFDEKINNRLRGVSRMDSLDIILEKANRDYSPEEKTALAEKKNAIYRKLLEKMTPDDVDPVVRKTLTELRERGIKLAVGSASKNTPFILERTDLAKYFDNVADGSMVKKSKPDPEVFLLAAQMMELSPEECVVVEDAEAGIDAAKAGGFYAVGIGDAAKYYKTDKPISDVAELLKLFPNGKEEEPKIRIEHLGKVYPNGVRAVSDFNLVVNDGEFVVFVGPSGCGKSTVLRMIAGLEPITEGDIYLDDQIINDIDPKDRNIAMVFQNYALYPHLTVRKNIAFPLSVEKIPFKKWFSVSYHRERRASIKEKTEYAASKIGLTDYLDRKPENLSGGQRQRVALGRAIVRNPKVFLLDEPLSNLDAKMRVQMRTEITRLHNELNTVFVYVTHDQVEAMTMGTKIVVMKDGVIQQVDDPEGLFTNPVNMFVAGFIGMPQMNFLEGTLAKHGDSLFAEIDSFPKTSLELPKGRASSIDDKWIGQKVIFGIRPKAISVLGDLSYKEQGIKTTISIFEQLGEETLVYTSLRTYDDKELTISTTGLGRFRNKQEIGISLDLSMVCVFDKDSGGSLL